MVFAGTKGYLDSLPVGDVKRFEKELLELHALARTAACSPSMRTNPKADVPAELGDLIAAFKERLRRRHRRGSRSRRSHGHRRRRARRSRERQDAGDGVSHGWRSGAHSSRTHSQRPGDEEDHARHGADRGVAHRQGAAARRRRRAVQRSDHRGRQGPRRRRWHRRSRRCSPVATRSSDGLRRHHRRPRPVRRLQRRRAARRRGRDQGRRAAGQRLHGDRRRSQGRGLLPLPRLQDQAHVHRLQRHTRRYADAEQIGEHVVELFVAGEVDRVELVYTRFISAGSQEVVQRPLVPLERETVEGGDGKRRRRRRHARRLRVRARPRHDPRHAAADATSRPASTPRCSTPRPASTPSASGR